MEDKLIDLEDCLQEVFDKFSISNAPSQLEGNDNFLSDGTLFYTLERDSPIRRVRLQFGDGFGDRIVIGRDTLEWGGKKIMPDIKKELERIKDMVQKRIHSTIDIEYCPNPTFIYIKINTVIKEYATYKSIKEYNEFDMEDLEDYLQEFFDKFSIIKTEPKYIIDDMDPYNNYFVVNIGDALDRKLINREEGKYTQQLLIDLYDSAIFANLEFERIKPNIERRIGVKLFHSFNKSNFFYRLKIW